MPYVKLPTVVSDYAVGLQSVNQARDNGDALRDLYDLNHSLGIDGYASPTGPLGGLATVGRHDDKVIARSVFRFLVNTALPVPVAVPVVGGPLTYAPPVRLGVGQWQVRLVSQQLVGAVALVESNAVVDRKATCVVTNGSSGIVTVSTWNVATPALADYDFDLIVWALGA
jgi:hypothetical protein